MIPLHLFHRAPELFREARLILRQPAVNGPERVPDILDQLSDQAADLSKLEQQIASPDSLSLVNQAMVEKGPSLQEQQRRIIDLNLNRLRDRMDTKPETRKRIEEIRLRITVPPSPLQTPAVPDQQKAWYERAREWTTDKAKAGWEWTKDTVQAGWKRTKEFAKEHPTLTIAIGSTLGIGLLYGLWKWWRGGKKNEGAEKEKQPAKKESLFWRVVRWIPIVGAVALAGWGVYEGVQWTRRNLQLTAQVKEWLKRGKENVENAAQKVGQAATVTGGVTGGIGLEATELATRVGGVGLSAVETAKDTADYLTELCRGGNLDQAVEELGQSGGVLIQRGSDFFWWWGGELFRLPQEYVAQWSKLVTEGTNVSNLWSLGEVIGEFGSLYVFNAGVARFLSTGTFGRFGWHTLGRVIGAPALLMRDGMVLAHGFTLNREAVRVKFGGALGRRVWREIMAKRAVGRFSRGGSIDGLQRAIRQWHSFDREVAVASRRTASLFGLKFDESFIQSIQVKQERLGGAIRNALRQTKELSPDAPDWLRTLWQARNDAEKQFNEILGRSLREARNVSDFPSVPPTVQGAPTQPGVKPRTQLPPLPTKTKATPPPLPSKAPAAGGAANAAEMTLEGELPVKGGSAKPPPLPSAKPAPSPVPKGTATEVPPAKLTPADRGVKPNVPGTDGAHTLEGQPEGVQKFARQGVVAEMAERSVETLDDLKQRVRTAQQAGDHAEVARLLRGNKDALRAAEKTDKEAKALLRALEGAEKIQPRWARFVGPGLMGLGLIVDALLVTMNEWELSRARQEGNAGLAEILLKKRQSLVGAGAGGLVWMGGESALTAAIGVEAAHASIPLLSAGTVAAPGLLTAGVLAAPVVWAGYRSEAIFEAVKEWNKNERAYLQEDGAALLSGIYRKETERTAGQGSAYGDTTLQWLWKKATWSKAEYEKHYQQMYERSEHVNRGMREKMYSAYFLKYTLPSLLPDDFRLAQERTRTLIQARGLTDPKQIEELSLEVLGDVAKVRMQEAVVAKRQFLRGVLKNDFWSVPPLELAKADAYAVLVQMRQQLTRQGKPPVLAYRTAGNEERTLDLTEFGRHGDMLSSEARAAIQRVVLEYREQAQVPALFRKHFLQGSLIDVADASQNAVAQTTLRRGVRADVLHRVRHSILCAEQRIRDADLPETKKDVVRMQLRHEFEEKFNALTALLARPDCSFEEYRSVLHTLELLWEDAKRPEDIYRRNTSALREAFDQRITIPAFSPSGAVPDPRIALIRRARAQVPAGELAGLEHLLDEVDELAKNP